MRGRTSLSLEMHMYHYCLNYCLLVYDAIKSLSLECQAFACLEMYHCLHYNLVFMCLYMIFNQYIIMKDRSFML